ncbi:bifunctional riboflavin kinase/FAD synthetase [Flavobacterium psychrotrophum]|uniref:bifunctional riboflavin kinase/FAD synthetase n=1 Tax=Flavobacterium psychrotrophum TaxID=2294119 RepID=UPI000E310007|nr:bifunctional riboflavin kinase/FAD synthetase [Flavobacterium psychrotrophum]
MKIYPSIQEFTPPAKTVVTLGTFDGVHKGHKVLLQKLAEASAAMGCQSVVLTFFPHPRMVLQQASDVKLLNTMEEKAGLLEAAGVDNLIIHPFSHEFSRLTAEEFVKDILVDKLRVGKIIIGHDHRFGRNRTATTADLIIMGLELGFEVEQISALQVEENNVSSTRIRNALTEGNITLANSYLGYPYFITGTVSTGKQLGRTIGYPTANIAIGQSYKLIPAHGVYAVSSIIHGKIVFGMMNIGTRPTVDGTYQTIEVNFFDFDADIYGAELKINLHTRLRDEHKFESLDALKQQLARDKENTQAFFNSHHV